MSVYWFVQARTSPLGLVRREGAADTLALAKAAVEREAHTLGTRGMVAEVTTNRGRWEYRPHARISGRMVWCRT